MARLREGQPNGSGHAPLSGRNEGRGAAVSDQNAGEALDALCEEIVQAVNRLQVRRRAFEEIGSVVGGEPIRGSALSTPSGIEEQWKIIGQLQVHRDQLQARVEEIDARISEILDA